jgi:hypothetical protein
MELQTLEMEFLDINLTKDLSLLLYAIYNLFYWRLLKKTVLYTDFKDSHKKSTKQENSSLFMNSILYNEKMRAENLSLRRLEFRPMINVN